MSIVDVQAVKTVPRSSRLVLLVDDSRAQRRTLAVQLIRAGYHVVEASNSDEAMAICVERRPDIVISDWMMPGQSGTGNQPPETADEKQGCSDR